jgi:hypothetical protein
MGWTTGVRFSAGALNKISFSTTTSRPALGPTQPPVQWVLVVRQSEHEADHLPASSAEVKNVWNYTSITPRPAIMVWCLIKYRDNFTYVSTW